MSAPKNGEEADVWEDLAQGELSREEEAVLRALAEEGEEAAVHYEAFAPLDEGFRSRTADKLAAQLQEEKHKKQRRRFAGMAGAFAIAAAALLLALPKESALAPYSLEVSGGVAEMRGAEPASGPLNYDAQSKLTLVAKPATPIDGKVVASLALLEDQRALPIPAKQQQAPTGAVRVEIMGRDVKSTSPSVKLALIVERKALTPEDIAGLARAGDPRVLVVQLKRAD